MGVAPAKHPLTRMRTKSPRLLEFCKVLYILSPVYLDTETETMATKKASKKKVAAKTKKKAKKKAAKKKR